MISAVCPVFNEEKYIDQVLEFFINAEPKEKELFIIDGGSTDRTVSIVKDYISKNKNIILIQNEKKYVPFALNLAIPKCRGEIIVRLDAHSVYDPNYFIAIKRTFDEVDADIVGGPMIAKGENAFQSAVAYSTSVPFGVGNSNFHFKEFKGYTDSVYLGAWKKSIFERTGLFDESLIRNQDDEFHYRAKSLGFKIYQNPEIRVNYFPRDSARKLFKQYFQYGLYKPRVLRKIKSELKIRHLIPFLFVLYLLTLPLAILYPIWLMPLLLYLIISFYVASRSNSLIGTLYSLSAFLIIHTGYGLGFMFGILKGR
jgi:succinoglycan biosynthesis protein ExoA